MKVLLLASYCDDCIDDLPCEDCLKMCNIVEINNRAVDKVYGGWDYFTTNKNDNEIYNTLNNKEK